jgi:hypothetical protein
VPLIPCAKGQLDEPALLALRHVGLATALHIIKIYNATQPLEPATAVLLAQLLSEAEWADMRASLLAALQELVDAFPCDYYPRRGGPDRAHLRALQAHLVALQAAWQQRRLLGPSSAQQQQQQQQKAVSAAAAAGAAAPADVSAMQDNSSGRDGAQQQQQPAAVVVDIMRREPAASAAPVFQDPLVPEGSDAAAVLARLNGAHITKLLEDLVLLLEQLYDVAEQASEHLVACKCC